MTATLASFMLGAALVLLVAELVRLERRIRRLAFRLHQVEWHDAERAQTTGAAREVGMALIREFRA